MGALIAAMASGFMKRVLTPAVLAEQSRAYGRQYSVPDEAAADLLGVEEMKFISRRDSFYMATNNEESWPYIQHRGGPRGFLKVLSPTLIAFGDMKGNRQLLSRGNIVRNNRVSLFLMDYPNRERLKILGLATILEAKSNPEWVENVQVPGTSKAAIERIFLIEIEGYDWNCPQHITPRYTPDEVEELMAPLRARIAELESRQ